MIKKETVGKASYDLQMQKHDAISAIEYEREMHKDYEKNILECLEHHKKVLSGDFFIVVLRKRERVMDNVFRTYFFGRKSCPTPTFDQTVYKYNRREDMLEFLWTIPDKETAHTFKENALEVQEKELLHMVMDFFDGTLDKKAAFLNNELPLIVG